MTERPASKGTRLPPLGLSQPTVSHHLKVLVKAGLLEREQRGRLAYFRLLPEPIELLRKSLMVPEGTVVG